MRRVHVNHVFISGFCQVLALSAPRKLPHLIHIVADDIGWHDLGISNPDMKTPHIDTLMQNGVQLARFYAQKECAPSRSSIMTGRLPFHYGYYENPSDDGGVPTNYTMLPQVLKSKGYKTHAIGKWHCGFRTAEHTPTYRGFDSFFGYWHWGEEYVDHVFPPYYKDAKCRGVDLTNASGSLLKPVFGFNGTQSTHAFVSEFSRLVQTHPADSPLYVYLAFQNAHDPYEKAPPELVKGYSARLSPTRRNFSAIVEDLDNGVGAVVHTLKMYGLWNNTVIWFNSDNGGELPFADQSKCNADCLTTGCCGGAGNNYPLRGGKFTLFEGGIRSRAFVHSDSSWIPAARRGGIWHGLSHVSDVFPTMAWLAGAEVISSGNMGEDAVGDTVETKKLDGFNLWSAIISNSTSPRAELLHQPLNMYWNASCTDADVSNPFTPSCGASITVWPYKLFIGYPGDARVVPSPSFNVSDRSERVDAEARQMCVQHPCLFHIEADPSESHDVAKMRPDLVQLITGRLKKLSEPQAVPQPADALTPAPSDEACAVVQNTGAWQPWEELQQAGMESDQSWLV